MKLEDMFRKARKKAIAEAIEMTEELIKESVGYKIQGAKGTECEILNDGFVVRTMEGTMKGKIGDYLMKGVEGELYVCDREVFYKTYLTFSDLNEIKTLFKKKIRDGEA